MIFTVMLDKILDFLTLFITHIPILGKLSLPTGAFDTLLNVLDTVAFFVPMTTVSMILTFWLAFESAKIVVAIFRFILKLIPFVG